MSYSLGRPRTRRCVGPMSARREQDDLLGVGGLPRAGLASSPRLVAAVEIVRGSLAAPYFL